MTWNLFWILFLFISGLGIVTAGLFNLKISSDRIILATLLILLGIKIMVNRLPEREVNRWDNTEFLSPDPEQVIEKNIIFRGDVFLQPDQHIETPGGTVDLNIVFGAAVLLIPDTMNVRILTDAVFASCGFPDGTSTHFGSRTYWHRADTGQPDLTIRADVVFGSLQIENIQP